MKTNKLYILKGGDKWGQVGTKSPLCPSLSLLKSKGGDKWGQGGDKMGTCPPSVVGTRWGQNFIYTPSLKGGIKCFVPLSPLVRPLLGGQISILSPL